MHVTHVPLMSALDSLHLLQVVLLLKLVLLLLVIVTSV